MDETVIAIVFRFSLASTTTDPNSNTGCLIDETITVRA